MYKRQELTKTLGEKAEAALEIQRLNSQVNKERSKISDTHKKIGEILWAKDVYKRQSLNWPSCRLKIPVFAAENVSIPVRCF